MSPVTKRRRGRTVEPLPATESLNPFSLDADALSVGELLQRLHAEDLAAVEAVGSVLPQVARAAAWAAESLRAGGRLLYVGAGTSGRLGLLDAVECPPTFGTRPWQVQAVLAGGRAAAFRAIEGAEDDRPEGARALRALKPGPNDLVVGISASGRTPFVLGALEVARAARARTVLLCASPSTAPKRAAGLLIGLETGPELIAGSTRLKAGTATKLVLNALSTAAMVSLGKVFRGRMVDLQPTNAKLRARATRMVSELVGAAEGQAQRLLDAAGGSPRLALAMHFTGLSRNGARAALRRSSLRDLENGFRARLDYASSSNSHAPVPAGRIRKKGTREEPREGQGEAVRRPHLRNQRRRH